MTLTPDQINALQNGEILRLQEDGVDCVVVRADVFDRATSRQVDGSGWTDQELRHALSRSADDNGWNEPKMSAYDNYDEEVDRRCH